ncbi:unnamed protein product [Caenorhabditis angaria]|uniref:CAP-Gly domain-containing protein n=1 Tax=Caenorhabditis angaria TaxID=860376 RepID=A0A9P1INH1_9PELO|nr:unnamed protein product [Caenorhabditis angaria]
MDLSQFPVQNNSTNYLSTNFTNIVEIIQLIFFCFTVPFYSFILGFLIDAQVRKSKELNTPFFKLCVSTGIIDLVTLFANYFGAVFPKHGLFLPFYIFWDTIYSHFYFYLAWSTGICQSMSVSLLATNRLSAILFANKYQKMWNSKRMRRAFAIQFFPGFLMGILTFFNPTQLYQSDKHGIVPKFMNATLTMVYFSIGAFFLFGNCIYLIIAYFYLFRVLRKRDKRERSECFKRADIRLFTMCSIIVAVQLTILLFFVMKVIGRFKLSIDDFYFFYNALRSQEIPTEISYDVEFNGYGLDDDSTIDSNPAEAYQFLFATKFGKLRKQQIGRLQEIINIINTETADYIEKEREKCRFIETENSAIAESFYNCLAFFKKTNQIHPLFAGSRALLESHGLEDAEQSKFYENMLRQHIPNINQHQQFQTFLNNSNNSVDLFLITTPDIKIVKVVKTKNHEEIFVILFHRVNSQRKRPVTRLLAVISKELPQNQSIHGISNFFFNFLSQHDGFRNWGGNSSRFTDRYDFIHWKKNDGYGEQVWGGVEWDDEKRGKHDGIVKGLRM